MWEIIAAKGAEALSTFNASISQSAGYDVQSTQARTQAKFAQLQGKANGLELLKRYNQSAGQDAVIAAAQGRSGGSVEAMASSASNQFDWDKAFNDISTQVRVQGYQSQADQYALASKAALIGGAVSAITGVGIDSAKSLYSIGGSTSDSASQAGSIGGSSNDGTLYKGGASGWY